MVSTAAKLGQNVFGRVDTTRLDVLVRLGDRFRKTATLIIVEVIPIGYRYQFHFRAVGQIGRFIEEDTTVTNMCLEGHNNRSF